ncbi:PH domain-containing protein [Peribacillus sp. NPDC097264]|uniref:PH domain-containing protein n=1 Tax=Peribacillus sp. NPDC097264 TaxID=3390616 RepID=UPI003CFBF8A1
MGVYQKLCFLVEDVMVKGLSRRLDQTEVKEKVETYRNNKAEKKDKKKKQRKTELDAIQLNALERDEQEKQRVLTILSRVVDVRNLDYTSYEFKVVKRNESFFLDLANNIYEPGEQGLTFVQCEYDKSKKQEMKGYLVVTNKRVLFIDNGQVNIQRFRYKTIKDISWFKDGVLERGIFIQYGVKRLEFDEIYDANQLKRVGNLIKSHSAQTA